ncbi:MAG: response regulator receiver protein [Bacteroidetes bacterium]|uniref:response regulator n=1 Tax=unclassified Chitinophaga TaxID=2619133 RepID=UPI0009D0216C|nr:MULTISPECIES: response regulator [unclassified Chitinophaga]MBP1652305.1 response regulator receiver protein [Bacteroidota bacterium]OMP78421.1 two-component system response regulator [[Flexibacter] sp. ATCC 35208]WPV68894.1 response regulator [Chitinophaga sp. LS1]
MSSIKPAGKISILIADDDADDRELIKAAFEENSTDHQISFVENGEELLLYLKRSGRYADETLHPLPHIILLDLNMPKKDGREALKEVKADPLLKCIPVIILTTSMEEKDIAKSYELGVNSYIIKPVTFSGLVEFTSILSKYWFEIAELPNI